MSEVSLRPCPICNSEMFITGKTDRGYSITSCGHKFKFNRTKSEKIAARRYVRMPWGLELVVDEPNGKS